MRAVSALWRPLLAHRFSDVATYGNGGERRHVGERSRKQSAAEDRPRPALSFSCTEPPNNLSHMTYKHIHHSEESGGPGRRCFGHRRDCPGRTWHAANGRDEPVRLAEAPTRGRRAPLATNRDCRIGRRIETEGTGARRMQGTGARRMQDPTGAETGTQSPEERGKPGPNPPPRLRSTEPKEPGRPNRGLPPKGPP